jgi:hypothetical protein
MYPATGPQPKKERATEVAKKKLGANSWAVSARSAVDFFRVTRRYPRSIPRALKLQKAICSPRHRAAKVRQDVQQAPRCASSENLGRDWTGMGNLGRMKSVRPNASDRAKSERGCGRRWRGVAQPGSALALGARGPRFESARPDQHPKRFSVQSHFSKSTSSYHVHAFHSVLTTFDAASRFSAEIA